MRKDGKAPAEEADFKLKSGTAWSHNYLNQKPWHPLSYPNQRRKWIAEQTHLQNSKLQTEVAKEFSQEQDFLKQAAMLSKKEKEKLEAMQAVSFMYTKPPGYNAESARAAEMADEQKKALASSGIAAAIGGPDKEEKGLIPSSIQGPEGEKRKPRAKDIFGRTIATAEEFPELKDAPRYETGVVGRAKPFGIEIRNVKCARCGAMGHQSGDRECPMKDTFTAVELERQRREDPISLMMTESAEPLKWELKQQPGGCSPPRGGFKLDDPNQQILPEEEEECVFDEYGGFLGGGREVGGTVIPAELLEQFSRKRRKEEQEEKRKKKRRKEKAEKRKARKKERKREKDEKRKSRKKREKEEDSEDSRERRKRKRYEESESEDSESSSDDTEEERASRRRRKKKSEAKERAEKGKKRRKEATSESEVSESSDGGRGERRERTMDRRREMDSRGSGSSDHDEARPRRNYEGDRAEQGKGRRKGEGWEDKARKVRVSGREMRERKGDGDSRVTEGRGKGERWAYNSRESDFILESDQQREKGKRASKRVVEKDEKERSINGSNGIEDRERHKV